MKRTQIIAVVAIALLVVAGVVASLVLRSDDEQPADSTSTAVESNEPTEHFRAGPQPWPVQDSNAVIVSMTEAGPTLALGADVTIALAPSAPGLELEWSRSAADDVTVFTGSGAWNDKPTTVTWSFARGNPQASFEIRVDEVTNQDLTTPLVTRFSLPAGDVRHVDAEMRIAPWVGERTVINGWTPMWMSWRGSQNALSLQQGVFDQARLVPAERGGVEVEFVWASDATRPRLAECAPEAEARVMGRFALTVGDSTPIFASRWPGGAEAGLIPVFEEPTTHPEASVRQGAPTSTEDAVRRITTVAHGHSDLSDPRHGNGGLLGVGLGGTVALPATIDEKSLTELQTAYSASRLELAGPAHSVAVTGGDCERVAAALEADANVIITGYSSWEGAYLNVVGDEALGMAPGPTPVTLPQLDGRRSSLTEQALGKLYIDRLLRERGGFAFSAPLQASRNPLIPAGKQGVLAPERDGHWTIAEDLALTLGDLELRVETEPLYVGGIGETYRHWHDTRQSEIWYTPDGVVLVSHAPVDDLTLVADGALDPNGPFVSGRDIRDARSAPQTWVWGALPDATPSEVAFGDSFRSPAGVEWVFESPVD